MKTRDVAFVALVALGCKRATPPVPTPVAQVASVPTLASGPMDASTLASTFEHGHHVVRGTVHLRDVSLRIVDMQMGRDLLGTAKSLGAVLAVNGGFFDPEMRPLGLARSEGRVLSKYTKTPGGVLVVQDGRGALFDAEAFEPSPSTFAIQCLPRLVVDRQTNLHRETGKRAERTALCLKQNGEVLEAVYVRGTSKAEHPTLLEFAEYLLALGCENALNLDGGPSSGIVTRSGEVLTYENPMGVIRHAIVALPSTRD